MKLTPHTYKAWWDLHAWGGLLSSLVVYVFFFFGSLTLFHSELAVWQEPRGPVPTLPEIDRVLDAGIADGSISRTSMRLNFPRAHSPGFSLGYTDGAGVEQQRFIEARGLVAPRSELAGFLYGMHYLQFPGGQSPGHLGELRAPRLLVELARRRRRLLNRTERGAAVSLGAGEPEARAALGFFSPLPVYALLGCLAARARSGWRAWAACGLATAVLKLLLVVL